MLPKYILYQRWELEGGGNRVDGVDRLEDRVNVTFIRSEKVNS